MNEAEFQRACEAVDGYMTLGLLTRAWALLDTLPAEWAGDDDAIALRIEILLQQRDFHRAATLAESLADLHPDDPEILVMAARYRIKGGDYQGAETWLTRIQDKCRMSGEFHYLNALCNADAGLHDAAKAALQTCFELDPMRRSKAIDEPLFQKVLFGAE